MLPAVIIVALLVLLVLVDTESTGSGSARPAAVLRTLESSEAANAEAGSRCILSVRAFGRICRTQKPKRAWRPIRSGKTENTQA
jgi:hypothetical protein